MSVSAQASMVVMADGGCGAQWPHRGTCHLLSLGVPFLFSLEDPSHLCLSVRHKHVPPRTPLSDPWASGFVNVPLRTRSPSGSTRPSLATKLGTLCPPPSSIGRACNPHTLALVFACVMVLGALLYSPFAWLFSSCAVRTRRAFFPVALCGLPISLAQTKRACPLPPHPLVGFFCICVFRLSLHGELGYSS